MPCPKKQKTYNSHMVAGYTHLAKCFTPFRSNR